MCTNCGAEITVDVPTIDTSKPVESVQVAVDAANQAAINSEVDSIVEAVEANASTSAVDDATAQRCARRLMTAATSRLPSNLTMRFRRAMPRRIL